MKPNRLARAVLIAALLFGLTAAPSVAQEQQPDDNVVTTTSCIQGVLSDDGQYCIVPRLDTPAPAPGQPAPLDAPVPSFTG